MQLLETVVDDLVASVIGEEVRGACGEELHSFQALEMVSEEVCADIVVGVVSQECLSISQEEYDSALKDRALLRYGWVCSVCAEVWVGVYSVC